MENNRKSRILIVDDEPVNLTQLSCILMPEYDVLAAKTGKTAIECANEAKPDLILLDILMPDMSGFEVISILKNSDVTSRIPVIFITGLDGSEYEEMGFHLGAVDYIAKPFVGTIVKARVKTHIQVVEQIRIIERLCKIDALTNLANRRYFDEQFEKEWDRASRERIPLGMILIDIDFFKVYNDTYGHALGDVLLKAAAKVFANHLNRSSDFAARFGGDEFVILLPNTDIEGAFMVAERVRLEIGKLSIPSHSGETTKVTVSMGVHSEIPCADGNMEDFFIKVDMAMYEAKKQGRNFAHRANN